MALVEPRPNGFLNCNQTPEFLLWNHKKKIICLKHKLNDVKATYKLYNFHRTFCTNFIFFNPKIVFAFGFLLFLYGTKYN